LFYVKARGAIVPLNFGSAPSVYWTSPFDVVDGTAVTYVLINKLEAGGRHDMPPPLQHDNIFAFLRQVAPVPVYWLFKTSATSWPLTFDLESGVRVTCDMGYLCANFSLPRPLCSWVTRQTVVRQTNIRQTDVREKHRLMPLPYNNVSCLYVKHWVTLLLKISASLRSTRTLWCIFYMDIIPRVHR